MKKSNKSNVITTAWLMQENDEWITGLALKFVNTMPMVVVVEIFLIWIEITLVKLNPESLESVYQMIESNGGKG